MIAYFADTSYYLGLFVAHDDAHAIATAVSATLDRPLVTTDYALLELAAYFAKPPGRRALMGFMEDPRNDAAVVVVRGEPSLFDRGLDLYARHADKNCSLTDCISFVVMQQRSIEEALTTDHHFEQAGFRALLREPRA